MARKDENLVVPHAREEGLVVEELPDELLVYDMDRHKAHCLNQTAALVWKHCDGQTPVQDIALILRDKLNTPADEEVVWFSLDQLNRARLLREPVKRPGTTPALSRRELIRRVGLAAALSVPLITTILAPTAFAALSCGTFSCDPAAPAANQCPTGSGCQCVTVPAGPCIAS
jgi:coenzyme PQQ synthesis protein D (PqqD)